MAPLFIFGKIPDPMSIRQIFFELRIYGKCLQNWMVWDDRGKKHITQVELAYTDYDPADGSVIQTGSEDFSMERYKHELTSKYSYTWNGEDRTEE